MKRRRWNEREWVNGLSSHDRGRCKNSVGTGGGGGGGGGGGESTYK